MCGLAGVLSRRSDVVESLNSIATQMSDCIVHRGPDDSGIWSDQTAGVALSFRRLSIIDLSPLGHQPMVSASGRFVIAFNGEIYNHGELRKRLEREGQSFVGKSDTEVMLAAFERWGIETALKELIGMFAIALWDCTQRRLHLIRDRLGKKPLFFLPDSSRGTLLFASELKSILASGLGTPPLAQDVIHLYLRYLYFPSPYTALEGVRKVNPGTMITIDGDDPGNITETVYWNLDKVAAAALLRRDFMTDDEAVHAFLDLLKDAVGLRLYADVPLGALLSGGIDSSLVVAAMQAQSARPVNTFCIGFDTESFDERKYSREVAERLGTNHHEMVVSGDQALQLVSRLPVMLDEPLANPSALPTYLVSDLARRFVTVVLTGDGGDELFAGYNRQALALRLQSVEAVPAALRQVGSHALRSSGSVGLAMINRLRCLRSGQAPALTRGRLSKLADVLNGATAAHRYQRLLSAWDRPELALNVACLGGTDPVLRAFKSLQSGDPLDAILLADQTSYLPDDLLAKIDRTSMAVSLEARAPLLDHRVVEFSWMLGPRFKLRGGTSKWIMREALARYLPRSLFERPKAGFTVPLMAWLTGPLKDWARDSLTDAAEGPTALFRGAALQREWKRLQSGDDSAALPIWTVVQLQEWRRHWESLGLSRPVRSSSLRFVEINVVNSPKVVTMRVCTPSVLNGLDGRPGI